MTTFVLVHGICHGAWCWQRTVDDLTELGHTAIAVDLALTSLDADAEIVENTLDAIDEPVVLVGHSYGGAVISKAASGRADVAHLVYVAAIMLDGNVVFSDLIGTFAPPTDASISIDGDGIITVSPEAARKLFYNSCSQHDADAAIAQLRPTAFSVLATATGGEPWNEIPSTYILCEQDHAIHPDFQRTMSAHAKNVVVIDTDHSPFLSTPEATLKALLSTL